MVHVQSSCFANQTYCFFFMFSLPSASLDLKVPNNSATSRTGFLIPKTSQMIRHRKSVLQGGGIFQTKEQIQTACSFQIQTKNPTERKFLIKTRFFTCWTMTGEKCTRAHVQENKGIYLSIYLYI